MQITIEEECLVGILDHVQLSGSEIGYYSPFKENIYKIVAAIKNGQKCAYCPFYDYESNECINK